MLASCAMRSVPRAVVASSISQNRTPKLLFTRSARYNNAQPEGMVIKKVSIIVIIALVLASLAIVAIAKYQRVIQPAITRGLAATADSGGGLGDLEADTLISAAKA